MTTNTNDAKAAAQSHQGERLMEAAKAKIHAAENPKAEPVGVAVDHKAVEAEIARSDAQRNKEMLDEYFAAKRARADAGEDEPAAVDIKGTRKRIDAVRNVDAGVVSIAETTTPSPSLDPRNVMAIDNFEEHESLLAPAVRAFDIAHKAIAEIFVARNAAAQNPEWTPAAQTIKTADFASKVQDRATKAWDAASSNLTKAIAHYEAELAKPLETGNQSLAMVALAGEIRSHCKQMDHADRQKFMRAAFAAKDTKTLQAILSGPSYLSGFDMQSHDHYSRQFHEMQNPTIVSRLSAMRKAQDLLDQRGPLIWSEVTRAIGVGDGGWEKINKMKAASNAAHAALILNDLA